MYTSCNGFILTVTNLRSEWSIDVSRCSRDWITRPMILVGTRLSEMIYYQLSKLL